MRIKFLTGPHAGEVQSGVPRDPYYDIMRKLGHIEFLPDIIPPKIKGKLTWTLARTTGPAAELHVVVTCTCGERRVIFNPSKHARFKCCGTDEVIPADLHAKGRKDWEKDALDRANASRVQAVIENKPYHIYPENWKGDRL
jgi:hypothetical protein